MTVFEDYVRARGPHLTRIAYLLTHDHDHAEDLVQTALVRSWSAWRRIEDNPEPYVRKVLVNTYASWRGRRWHGELPSSALPEVAVDAAQTSVDNRDEVWRALRQLPRQQQAVLVLRYFEDMTEAQIAEALDISVGAVKSHASRGLGTLRMDETLQVEPVEIDDGRVDAVRSRIRRRRIRRAGAAVVASAIVIALVMGFLTGWNFRINATRPPDHPGVGSYFNGDRIVGAVTVPIGQIASLTVPPTSPAQDVFIDCVSNTQSDYSWIAEVALNGKTLFGVDCDKYSSTETERVTAGTGLHGALTARLAPAPGADPAPATAPTHGTIYLAIGEPVPFVDYPLPKRPKQLRRLAPASVFTEFASVGILTAQNPTMNLPAGEYSFLAQSQTPGLITVAANGKSVFTAGYFDYGAGYESDSHTFGKGDGEITVSVSSQYTTGSWYVDIQKGPSAVFPNY